MATIKEAWAKLTDAKQEPGVRGHEFVGGRAHKGLAHDPMTCPHCNDIRAYGLAVLDATVDSANVVLRSLGEAPIIDGHNLRAEIEGGS